MKNPEANAGRDRDSWALAYKRVPQTHLVAQFMEFLEQLHPVSMAPDLYYRPISCPPSQAELATLAQLRTAAGWYLDRISQWELEVAIRQRYIWFIHFPHPLALVMGAMEHTPAIGMVSLLLENPMDPSLASFTTNARVEITSLFVLASYRHLGVGIAALQEMERCAKSLGARWVTLNTPAIERSLTIFGNLGYREYKARQTSYPQSEIRGAGLPQECTTAAFLEKELV